MSQIYATGGKGFAESFWYNSWSAVIPTIVAICVPLSPPPVIGPLAAENGVACFALLSFLAMPDGTHKCLFHHAGYLWRAWLFCVAFLFTDMPVTYSESSRPGSYNHTSSLHLPSAEQSLLQMQKTLGQQKEAETSEIVLVLWGNAC